ncbi:hypothetical protein [Sphingomonas sp.]|uniref:hypothetical protein n=1 Tax=Sphingomonas sp. TaxID=28214 RepID=UPI002ED7F64B
MDARYNRRAAIGAMLATAVLPAWAARADPGPAPLPPTFSTGAMAADVALLRRAYETLHPGLHRYQRASESTARFDWPAETVRQPMTPAAFYLALSKHLATVRCGHSYANFYNQQKRVQAALFDAAPRLPLSFLWLGDRMIVTADAFATGIAPGSEILAIDGRPAGEILAALMTVARADGHNDAKRRRLMSCRARTDMRASTSSSS